MSALVNDRINCHVTSHKTAIVDGALREVFTLQTTLGEVELKVADMASLLKLFAYWKDVPKTLWPDEEWKVEGDKLTCKRCYFDSYSTVLLFCQLRAMIKGLVLYQPFFKVEDGVLIVNTFEHDPVHTPITNEVMECLDQLTYTPGLLKVDKAGCYRQLVEMIIPDSPVCRKAIPVITLQLYRIWAVMVYKLVKESLPVYRATYQDGHLQMQTTTVGLTLDAEESKEVTWALLSDCYYQSNKITLREDGLFRYHDGSLRLSGRVDASELWGPAVGEWSQPGEGSARLTGREECQVMVDIGGALILLPLKMNLMEVYRQMVAVKLHGEGTVGPMTVQRQYRNLFHCTYHTQTATTVQFDLALDMSQ